MGTINFKWIILYSSIIALFTFTGCKKDSVSTKTELLCQEWKLAHFLVQDGSDLIEVDIDFEMTLNFDIDNHVTGSSTYGGENETETNVWQWINDENTIRIGTSNDHEDWDVQKLTNQELWIKFLSGSGNYVVYKFERK
jgi:hypothetical protein